MLGRSLRDTGKASGTAEASAMSVRALGLLLGALTIAFTAGTRVTVAGAATPDGLGAVPSIGVLRARISSARGTPPRRERLTVTYTYGGVAGKRVTVRDGSDERVDDSYGPLILAKGEYRGQTWHQNENGETVLEQPDPGNATGDATTTTVTRVTTPLDALVIATLNAAGNGSKEYIDPASYRIVRWETIRPTGTSTTVYDDFHRVAEFTRAWHWTVRDGHPENDADYHVSGDDVVSAVPSLRIPDSRRNLVEFPVGKTSVDLPVREDHGQFIVRVQIGGRGLDFALDTGASGIVLDDDQVRVLGLPHYGAISNAANAGRFVTTQSVVPEMSIGELRMHNVVISTMPHIAADGADYKVVGLLGFDFIGALALKLDYQRARIAATQPEAFVPPSGSGTYPIAVRLGRQIPLADVSINGALGERFLIDTGAAGTMLVFDFFARRHHEALSDARFLEDQLHFTGAGGAFQTQPYRVNAVRFGNIKFTDFTIYRVTSAQSFSGDLDGLLGSGLLQLFTVYTSYGSSMVYLVPNTAAGQ